MHALYRRPSDPEAMAQVCQHLQQSPSHRQIRQQLQAFQKTLVACNAKPSKIFITYVCKVSGRFNGPVQGYWAS